MIMMAMGVVPGDVARVLACLVAIPALLTFLRVFRVGALVGLGGALSLGFTSAGGIVTAFGLIGAFVSAAGNPSPWLSDLAGGLMLGSVSPVVHAAALAGMLWVAVQLAARLEAKRAAGLSPAPPAPPG